MSHALSSPSPRASVDEESTRIVRVAFLVRLVALAAGMVGLLGRELTGEVLLAVLVLAASSYAGLTQQSAVDALVRHPLLAISDVAVVLAVIAVLGVASPLALAGLSTALLIGLLYAVPVAALVGGTLVIGYAGAALSQDVRLTHDSSFVVVGMPVTLICLMGIGHAVRRLQESQRCAVAELGRLAHATAAVEERERLAREIHDSVAKSLQGVAATATALPAFLGRDPSRAGEAAHELARTAGLAVEQTRGLLSRMRADDPLVPLHEVLDSVARAWGDRHGVAVGLDLAPVVVATSVRYELLAAVREALENVARHAPGASVSLGLTAAAGAVRLVVCDDGPGFDLASIPEREAEGHFGITGMRERLESAGGLLHVESRPGAGTRLTLQVPGTPVGASARRVLS